MTFLTNLYTVAEQVLILFLLIGIGVVCGKFKVFTDETIKYMSDFCLKVATTAVIIQSFLKDYQDDMIKGLLLAMLGAVICHIIAIFLSSILFRDKDLAKRGMLRNSSIFSNAGFMGLPLQLAILGSIGVFYGAAYVVVFQVFLWTYAYTTSSGGTVKMSIKKAIINPGVITVIIGLPLFLFSVKLPEVLTTTIGHVASLNTPLPMIIVGYYVSKTNFKKIKEIGKGYFAIIMKMLVIPLMCLAILLNLGYRGDLLVSLIISISAPTAVAVTMFTSKFGGDAELAATVVTMSTLFSIITMPLIVALAQTVAVL